MLKTIFNTFEKDILDYVKNKYGNVYIEVAHTDVSHRSIETLDSAVALINAIYNEQLQTELYFSTQIFQSQEDAKNHQSVSLLSMLYFDFDNYDQVDLCKEECKKLYDYLKREFHLNDDQVSIFFSGGKGFHLCIPVWVFEEGFESNVMEKLKKTAIAFKQTLNLTTLDLNVYKHRQLFRAEGSYNKKGLKYKVRLERKDLERSLEDIYLFAENNLINYITETKAKYPSYALKKYLNNGGYLAEPGASQYSVVGAKREDNNESVDLLVNALKPLYVGGQRQMVWLYFSGYCAKVNKSMLDCFKVLYKLYKDTGDSDDVSQRLTALLQSYVKLGINIDQDVKQIEEIMGRSLHVPAHSSLSDFQLKGISGLREICNVLGLDSNHIRVLRKLVENIECEQEIDMNETEKEEEKGKKSVKFEKMIEIAKKYMEPFVSDEMDHYVVVNYNGVKTVHKEKSPLLDTLLIKILHENGIIPNSDNKNLFYSAIRMLLPPNVLAAQKKLSLRTALYNNAFYINPGLPDLHLLKITEGKTEIIENTNPEYPIIFKPYNSIEDAIPYDQAGTKQDLEAFMGTLNLSEQEDFMFYKVYICTAFIPEIPKPIAIVLGPPGSAKTSFARATVELIDGRPNSTMTYYDDKEVIHAFDNYYCVFFDNISALNEKQVDTLCKATTGDAIVKRRLYTDKDISVFKYKRLIGLTAINLPSARTDLMDRALMFELQPVNERKLEKELMERQTALYPKVRGFVFFKVLPAAISVYNQIIKNKEVDTSKLPRMADFCMWGEAVARVLGYTENEFVNALANRVTRNFSDLAEGNIFAEILIKKILKVLKKKDNITISNAGLWKHINKLKQKALEKHQNSNKYNNQSYEHREKNEQLIKSFPNNPIDMSRKLKNMVNIFRAHNIIAQPYRKKDKRGWQFTLIKQIYTQQKISYDEKSTT